jgi:hypothetical protein
MVQKTFFTSLFKSYPRFIQKDKTRIWSKKRFQPFLSHIVVDSQDVLPTGFAGKSLIFNIMQVLPALFSELHRLLRQKNVFKPFLSHIRVLSKRIKRGYGQKNVFQPFLSHIRVLSKRIKRGYGPKNYCPRTWTNKNQYLTHGEILKSSRITI